MEGAGLGRERGEKSRKSTAGLRVGCFEGADRSYSLRADALVGDPEFFTPPGKYARWGPRILY